MISKIQQIDKQDLSWFIGFFVGDGYTTRGRIGIDTTSPDAASKILSILQNLSDKVKVEIYGNPEIFSNLTKNALFYPRRKSHHSDYVKIRIDDTKFQKEFVEFKEKYIKNVSYDLIGDFLMGFFDAEATVSPVGQIEIDLAKESKILTELIGSLLTKLEIKHKIKEHKSRIRLEVLGTSRNIQNLIKFQKYINFYDRRKKAELKNMIRIYSISRNKPADIKYSILTYIKENPSAELKTLMTVLNVKYDFLNNSLNSLIKNGKIEKFELKKRKCFKILS